MPDLAGELIEEAAAALRREVAPAPASVLLASRFGCELLGEPARRARPIELPLADGRVRLVVRHVELGGASVLAIEAGALRSPWPAELLEALPVLAAGRAGVRAALHLLSALGLARFRGAPALAPVGDWLRLGDGDPLRSLAGSAIGPRYPELRGAARPLALAPVAAALSRHAMRAPVVAAARRGPSGPTDAELAAADQLGAEVLVEGCAAEYVAARHQGLLFVAVALVLDEAAVQPPADPGQLAEAATRLALPLAALVADLAGALAASLPEAGA